MRRRRQKPRSWSDHLQMMEDDKRWFRELESVCEEATRGLDQLDDEVRSAVTDTGYPSFEALRLQRTSGPKEAVRLIRDAHRLAMYKAYGRLENRLRQKWIRRTSI